jgi:hypothetical protein
MVQLIVDRYGTDAIARIMAAFRDGASDAEALEAGTGVTAEQLYADFYASFGADVPEPVAANPMQPSNVDRPDPGTVDPGGVPASPGGEPAEPASPAEPGSGSDLPVVMLLVVAGAAAVGAAFLVVRRAARIEARSR